MKQVCVNGRPAWRAWLTRYHDKEDQGIWLIFLKNAGHRPCLRYEEAVEEALCFGWIDSVVRKMDDRLYMRKFTPRRSGSGWSKLNKARAQKMIQEGKMTEFGLVKINEAKESGHWDRDAGLDIDFSMPEALARALSRNTKAKAAFDQLAPSCQKHYIGWIATAKRQETLNRRIQETLALLVQGEKLGLK